MKKTKFQAFCFCLAFAVNGEDCFGTEIKIDTVCSNSAGTTSSDYPNSEKDKCSGENLLNSSMEVENFSEDNAFFAVSGARMDLNEASEDNPDLIQSAINTLISVKECNLHNVPGFKYCLGMLCLNFEQYLTDNFTQKALFGTVVNIHDIKEKGEELMKEAKDEGDFDAADYFLFKE